MATTTRTSGNRGSATRWRAPSLGMIEQQARAAQLNFTLITMTGHGQEQPPEYLKLFGAWTRSEKLPEIPVTSPQ